MNGGTIGWDGIRHDKPGRETGTVVIGMDEREDSIDDAETSRELR